MCTLRSPVLPIQGRAPGRSLPPFHSCPFSHQSIACSTGGESAAQEAQRRWHSLPPGPPVKALRQALLAMFSAVRLSFQTEHGPGLSPHPRFPCCHVTPVSGLLFAVSVLTVWVHQLGFRDPPCLSYRGASLLGEHPPPQDPGPQAYVYGRVLLQGPRGGSFL